MGIAKNMKAEAADRRHAKSKSKYTGFEDGASEDASACFLGVDNTLLADCFNAVIGAGDALMLGSTRDGSAVTVGLYEGGERVLNKVTSSTAALEDVLTKILDAARGL